MMQGKRYGTAVLVAIVTAVLTYVLAAANTGTWAEGFQPGLVYPAVAAGLSSFLSFLQPSTVEGLQSARERRDRG